MFITWRFIPDGYWRLHLNHPVLLILKLVCTFIQSCNICSNFVTKLFALLEILSKPTLRGNVTGAHFKKWCWMQSKIKTGAVTEVCVSCVPICDLCWNSSHIFSHSSWWIAQYKKDIELMLKVARAYLESSKQVGSIDANNEEMQKSKNPDWTSGQHVWCSYCSFGLKIVSFPLHSCEWPPKGVSFYVVILFSSEFCACTFHCISCCKCMLTNNCIVSVSSFTREGVWITINKYNVPSKLKYIYHKAKTYRGICLRVYLSSTGVSIFEC